VILHMRYTAREAGNLRAPAVAYVQEEVLQDPANLLQLFCLNYDFADAWHAFTAAPNDAARHLVAGLTTDHFPYWLKRLGMDDTLVATFAVIDWKKGRLTLGPATVTLDGDVAGGWTLDVVQASPIFAFLKKNLANKVYMAVSYAAAS
jgi:hypothetical protein